MSDQQAPATPDTPAVAGPTEAPGTQEQPQTDWEKRYQDLQPEYTRTAQERAELAQWKEWAELALTTDDPDTQRQALQHLGYDIPDEVEDVEPAEWTDDEDPVADLRAQIAQEREWRQGIEEAAQAAAAEEFLNDHVQSEFQRLGIDKLDDRMQDVVKRLIPSAPGIPTPPGAPHDELPDVEAIWNYFQETQTEMQKSWAQTKRSAPYVPPGGQPANEVPNTGTGHEARMDRAMRFMFENSQQD
jgi:hypothetical protein